MPPLVSSMMRLQSMNVRGIRQRRTTALQFGNASTKRSAVRTEFGCTNVGIHVEEVDQVRGIVAVQPTSQRREVFGPCGTVWHLDQELRWRIGGVGAADLDDLDHLGD